MGKVVRGGTPTPGFETPLYRGNSKKTKKKKRKTWLWILLILLVLGIVVAGFVYYYFGGLNTDKDFKNKTESELGIDASTAEALKMKGVTNVALFGLDARDGSDTGRSDATMILSIDWDHSKVKLTSLARDTYIQIDDYYGYSKLCHAYAYGGPELAIKMINQNFNLNITDYVTVNFDQLAAVIDEVGGVTVELTDNEVYVTNQLILKEKIDSDLIPSSGKVLLNGHQAVCFSRIRKNAGNDAARTGRQRMVLNALFDKAMDMNVTEYPGLAKTMLPMVKTSLDYTDCIKYASILLKPGVKMELASFPDKVIDVSQSGMINGTWYYVYDIDLAADMVHAFIYDDIHPEHYFDEPTDEVSSSEESLAE